MHEDAPKLLHNKILKKLHQPFLPYSPAGFLRAHVCVCERAPYVHRQVTVIRLSNTEMRLYNTDVVHCFQI